MRPCVWHQSSSKNQWKILRVWLSIKSLIFPKIQIHGPIRCLTIWHFTEVYSKSTETEELVHLTRVYRRELNIPDKHKSAYMCTVKEYRSKNTVLSSRLTSDWCGLTLGVWWCTAVLFCIQTNIEAFQKHGRPEPLCYKTSKLNKFLTNSGNWTGMSLYKGTT